MHKLEIYFFSSLWPHLWHKEIARLGVEWELQLPAYTTATTIPDPRLICKLHHSSWQHQILNPLSEARDRTTTSWFLVRFVNHCTTTGTPIFLKS